MLSRWLRLSLTLEAALALGVALLAWAGSLGVSASAALGAATFLVLNSLAVFVSYGFALRYAYAPPPDSRAPSWEAWAAAALEWLATFALFVVIQPFERWWMGQEGRGQGTPAVQVVLLVHGYLCNRGVWWWLRRGLRARGRAVATVNLEPPLAGLEDLAECLHHRISALLAETGTAKVLLVGHSMGGLVARAYLRRYGPDRVAKLITLGAPHHGTQLARIGLGLNAQDMKPDSRWMRGWAGAEAAPLPTLSVWSLRDNFVMPQDSSRLAGTREIALPTLGHLSMAFSPKILEILLDETAESSPP